MRKDDLFKDLSLFVHQGSLRHEGIAEFQALVKQYYHAYGRRFAWRETTDPFRIVVSEVMLQQTQTDRVKDKYENFIAAFSGFEGLAGAPFARVLFYWQGLGYNRRALALHKLATIVCERFNGSLPADPDALVELPGIGKATAASICAFAFNYPSVFIETNIRAVYIHTFFRDKELVKDSEIVPLVAVTLDRQNSREWYYALMDYGAALKKTFTNPSRKSAHHVQQSRFEGSERQIRGMILKNLTLYRRLSFAELCEAIDRESDRIQRNLHNLCNEGFIIESGGVYSVKTHNEYVNESPKERF